MARRKKSSVKRESEPTGTGEVADTKAIQNWLRVTDRPLAKNEGERRDVEPKDQ